MKWIALKTQQPPNGYEVFVSDGNYVHEAVKSEYGWTSPEPVSGYDTEFFLHPSPLYWAHKPKAPKVCPEDISDPVVPKKRKYVRPPKKGTIGRMLHDEAKRIGKNTAAAQIEYAKNSPWVKLLEPGVWPNPLVVDVATCQKIMGERYQEVYKEIAKK